MRLWSLHPRYLDIKGLLAVWREGLLAKKVLEGKTRGYRNHLQLIRFKRTDDPVRMINAYLYWVYEESRKRGYNFDSKKIECVELREKLPVTRGQLDYEFRHLLGKLSLRQKELYYNLRSITVIEPHPIFYVIPGEVEEWEKIVG